MPLCDFCGRRKARRRGLCNRCYDLARALGFEIQGYDVPAPGRVGRPASTLAMRVVTLVRRMSPETRAAVESALQTVRVA